MNEERGGSIVIIDPASDVPLFVQIAEQIEDDVFTGVYIEGDRVPSTNELSALLGINPHTVQDGARDKVRVKRKTAFDERYVAALVAEAKKLGFTKEQVVDLVEKGYDHV